MKLIQEIEKITGYTQSDLKSSDGSSAGKDDVAAKTADVSFSLMRNVINTQNGVTGSDVSNYLERAHELNDEVDTIGFVIETDDNDFIKIYVNATQADEFEKEMANLLGLEDDPEAAINTLAQKFDIVDVVWPQDPDGDDDGVTIDNADELGQTNDAVDEPAAAVDEPTSDEPASDELEATLSSSETVADTSAGAEETPPEGEEVATSDAESGEESGEESSEEDDEEDSEEESGQTKAGGKKKKKKGLSKLADAAKQKFEEGRFTIEMFASGEDERSIGLATFSFITESAATAHISLMPQYEGVQYRVIDRHQEQHTAVAVEQASSITESTTENQGETDMTIGSQFLKRVLQEAEDRDGVIDGMNIPLDSQYRALAAQLKRPIEKKLVALYSMTGIPGRYVNSVDGIKDRVMAAGDMLRKSMSVRRAFDEFYNALAAAKGFAPAADAVAESVIAESKVKRGSFIQKKMETILTMLGLPEDIVTSEGPGVAAPALYRTAKMIDQSAELQAAMNKLAIRMGIKAVDVAAPVAEETVLESKGPVSKMYSKALHWYKENCYNGKEKDHSLPFIVRQDGEDFFFSSDCTTNDWDSQRSVSIKIGADGKASRITTREFMSAGSQVNYPPLSKGDKKAAKMIEAQIAEEVDVGNDEFYQKVIALATALGIPERNLQFQRPALVKSLREKKISLQARGMIETRMDQLLAMIEKNTRKTPGNDAA